MHRKDPAGPLSRAAVLSLAIAASGCAVGWQQEVRYSSEPLPPSASVARDLYAVTLDEFLAQWKPVIVMPSDSPTTRLVATTVLDSAAVPTFWPDSLKREVRAALTDPHMTELLSDSVILSYLAGRVHVQSGQPVPGAQVMRLWLSRPGFNADSTMAAIRITVLCGLRCGSGEVWLLARRPGVRWRIWRRITSWVS